MHSFGKQVLATAMTRTLVTHTALKVRPHPGRKSIASEPQNTIQNLAITITEGVVECTKATTTLQRKNMNLTEKTFQKPLRPRNDLAIDAARLFTASKKYR